MNPNQQYRAEYRKPSLSAWALLLGVIIVLGVATYFLRDQFFGTGEVTPVAAYQAVFLTNGQVYFGSISKVDSNYVVLKNIYYLQANSALQGTTADSQPFTLVKLGKELHGPTDIMYINRQQILFYEDLRDDSSVVKTIQANKK